MEVLAIIQARGGSKSVPRKNIKLFAGKPLLAWTIEAAKQAGSVTRVIVSTEDEEIASIARQYGAEVPFMRPLELASDQAKSIGLLIHALEWLKENEGYEPDLVVQLKPTNPLRRSEHIDSAVGKFIANPGYDSLMTVTRSPAHPLKTWAFHGDEIKPFVSEEVSGIREATKQPRQSLPEAYVQNSCVYVIHPKTILEKRSSMGDRVLGMELPREDSINIDDMLDLDIAELIMHKRIGKQT